MLTANIPWFFTLGNLHIAVENQEALKNVGYWSEMDCSLPIFALCPFRTYASLYFNGFQYFQK